MSIGEWISPLLSFGGATLGTWLVYRFSRTQEWGRRFESALDLVASDDARQRALGRVRIQEISRHESAGKGGRREALAILREDVRASCPEDVWRALSAVARGDGARVWVAEDDDFRVDDTTVCVTRSLVESAKAYVDIAGGEDAVPDRAVVLIAQAATASDPTTRGVSGDDSTTAGSEGGRPLPTDQRLLLIKLTPDGAALSPTDLKERTRKAWRLSIDRLRSEPPVGVAAVVQQRVRGAWRVKDVVQSSEHSGRVEFLLGDELPELVDCEFRDTGQNPVRYWP